MADFASALNNLGNFQSSLQQYVVTPANAFGLAGFVFDIEGEARVELNNDITDHYVEDNSAVQDHIAVKPKRITLRNYVGELVHKQDNTTDTPLQQAVQKLTVLTAALPTLAIGAQQAYNLFQQQSAGASSFGQAVTADSSAGANLYALAKNLVSAQNNKQQAAYQYLKALRDQKMIFSIQTPFEFMTSMAIENIIMIQPEETTYMSSVSVTFKEIRPASTLTITVNNGQTAGITAPLKQCSPSDPLGNGLSSNPADYQARAAVAVAPTIQNGSMQGLDPSSLPTGSPLHYPANIQDLMNTDGFRNALKNAQ